MPTAWRIVKSRHVGSAFDGEGARRYGGRWNSPGTAVVYASETRALCLLEVLAGLRSVKPLHAYVFVPATFDDSLVRPLPPEDLPPDWQDSPPHPSAQQVGDTWVDQKESAILRVPSAIIPSEYNYLFDPAHPDFEQIRIGAPQELAVDSRLLS
jgi:RES domain-containing protein